MSFTRASLSIGNNIHTNLISNAVSNSLIKNLTKNSLLARISSENPIELIHDSSVLFSFNLDGFISDLNPLGILLIISDSYDCFEDHLLILDILNLYNV